jgi:anhydro-N-acetylmuramic acid kinase
MVYKVIGLMSGSSLDGLDIAYVELQERLATGGAKRGWSYELLQAACLPYDEDWRQRLAGAKKLSALDYQYLHTEYGRYLGQQVLQFIEQFGLQYRVQLIGSHGHTAFHDAGRRMTAQLGDGAALAATTRINVVSDLRAMDVALGGQGAPIVPIGERLLLPDYEYFLNLGGIANISHMGLAFDVCPANRVLNELAADEGRPYDEGGAMAAGGQVDEGLLGRLNALPYYAMPWPKSLANEFGTEVVLPLVRQAMIDSGGRLSTADALRTYGQHIVEQVGRAVQSLTADAGAGGGSADAGADERVVTGADERADPGAGAGRMLVTGGGAHNTFLVEQLRHELGGIAVVVPDAALVDYKEALIMALIGVLRWREENNVLASVTGASRDSIGGAVWIGQEA